MALQHIESKVESLEKRVTELERLPARVEGLESQIQQLRTEMHAEFSAVRGEMSDMESRLEAKIDLKIDSKIDGLGVQMRVLHEEVISRIALIQEGLPSRKPRKKQADASP